MATKMQLLNRIISNAIGFFIGLTTLILGVFGYGKILYVVFTIWKGEREFETSSFIVSVIVASVLILLGYAILRASTTERTAK